MFYELIQASQTLRQVLLSTAFAGSLFCLVVPIHAQPAPKTEYEILYEDLQKLTIERSSAVRVTNFKFSRDAATFSLKEGTLYSCRPVRRRQMAIAFEGIGGFSFTPSLEVERNQLHRYFGKSQLQDEVTGILFLFTDSTRTILDNLAPIEVPFDISALEAIVKKSLKLFTDKGTKYFYAPVMKSLLDSATNDLFLAVLRTKNSGILVFGINPYGDENVFLGREQPNVRNAGNMFEVISQFHSKGRSRLNAVEEGRKEYGYLAESYSIDGTITEPIRILAESFGFSLKATVQIKSSADHQRWIRMELDPDLRVDSLFWGDNSPTRFFRSDEGFEIWIDCQKPLMKDELRTLTFYYHGDILQRWDARIILRSSTLWYPTQFTRTKSRFDVTFRYPSDYSLVAVGDLESESTAEEVTVARWKTQRAVRNFSFNMGEFRQKVVMEEGIPLVNVLMTKAGDNPMHQTVTNDVVSSVKMYTRIFGPTPVSTLHVTEIPGSHGEAFPGLIHLSALTFLRDFVRDGSAEVFRAHEVAHQWWGIGVDFESYHDQWLSEAFSTYSGLMVMQAVLKDNRVFFEELERYRRMILDDRRRTASLKAGPVWLGYRNETSETQGDFQVLVYRKGAWVLHMLRNMLLDLKTLNEDTFNSILKLFYGRYANGYASTESFRSIVEKRSGEDMSWFFRQWVYGADIPTYRFAYRVVGTTGNYIIQCRVTQSGVPDDFQMYVPIRIDFGENRLARVRVLIKGPTSTFELPPMPFSPEEVTFNDLHSVLCEVETTRWEE